MIDETHPVLEAVDAWDLDALIAASRALYVDEGERPPAERSLRIALHRRLRDDAHAVLFRSAPSAALVGFALYAPRRDQVRIEQFRIEPELRRRGWGRRCIAALLDGPLARAERIEVRVLEDNASGRAFWTALGFGAGRLELDVVPRP